MHKNYEGVKGILIARVSEEAQRKALPAQKRNLMEYADKRGLVVDEKKDYFEFDETAYKGDERAKFHELTEEISRLAEKEFQVVVFDKIDRFSRDYSDESVQTFRKLVKKGKIELHFASEGLIIHKNSPASDWTRLGLGMVMSENYSACVSDNVKRWQKNAVAVGKYPGKVPIGYLNVTTGYDARGDKITDVIVDKKRAPYIKKAYELRLQGYSVKAITLRLKEDGLTNPKTMRPLPPSSIDVMLKNPFYAGEAKWGDTVYKHCYPPIIDARVFEVVQRINDENAKDSFGAAKTSVCKTYPHSKLLYCGICGGVMSPYTKKGHVYLRCSKSKAECGNCGVSEVEVDETVTDVLDHLQIADADVARILKRMKDKHDNEQRYFANQIKQARDEYRRLEHKKDVAYDDRLNGSITLSRYEKIAAQCDKRMAELDEQVAQLESEDGSFLVDAAYLLELAKRAAELYKSSRNELKNKLLKTIFSNLKSTNKKVDFSLLKGIDYFFYTPKTELWLPGPGSNRQPRS